MALSRDHIFPQFLGGKRKVDCCKNCNSVFGHTFEAEAAKILQAEHVFISSWGLPLRSADPTWKAAHVQ
ncbi:MAG: HNH endonuclease, partial [Acidobacteriota bacterium]|nr:HNH endonuclease [Acidobacteriota bacterium]